ncbi:hypothetical protein ACIHCV_35250 [Streptomyces sp. NPDC051956]|uniref:hypothetical protein n=1 Tax=Streptomyces sp. NPDC051956 TaxID=3365677 RepID=UPI0037D121C9
MGAPTAGPSSLPGAAGEEAPSLRDAGQLAAQISEFIERRLMGEGRQRPLARHACAVERTAVR